MLLLDTHIYVWARAEPDRLSPRVREAVASSDAVYVSIVTAWELAILQSLDRLRLPEPFAASLNRGGYRLLPVDVAHTEAVAALPLLHRDPFDRMLIAQAMTEGLALATADRQIAQYDIPLIDG